MAGFSEQIFLRLLGGPDFKGRARLMNWMRSMMTRKPILAPGLGVEMYLDPTEWLQAELAAGKTPEPLTVALLKKLLTNGMTFVDVGAHVGSLALVAAKEVGSNGCVVAIDPQPVNGAALLRNAEVNGFSQLKVLVAAISDQAGTLTLRMQKSSDFARLTIRGEGVNDTGQAFLVPAWRVDDLYELCALETIDVLKVDVEGVEVEVLSGISEARLPRDVIVEILPEQDSEVVDWIVRWAARHDYSLQTVTGKSWTPGQELPEHNLWCHR